MFPSQNSSGTGFCCSGGDLKTNAGRTLIYVVAWKRQTIVGGSICGARALKQ